ncbi:hypothetical protein [Bacillus thuringiensis]|uniref:hypothetical protein n=1 Tax=Bacillus thuringiensis TaxID=1428 RepID=UPI00159B998D|nr:hypothetical protein [Bacillus thuringiensis]
MLCMEVFFSLPLLIDSLINAQAVWVVMVIGALHVFLYMYAKSGVVTKGDPAVHVLGILAMVTSFIPVVGFVLHVPVAVKGIKHIIKQYKPKEQRVDATGSEEEEKKSFRQRLGEFLIQDKQSK